MNRKQLLLISYFILFIFVSLKSFSSSTPHWETVFYSDTIFTYTTSNEGDPGSDWRNLNFNAENWETGKGGIGYADNDDSTIIATCNALFLRRTFTIHNKLEITGAVLSIDYDDAFVAYLNGEEIARSPGLSEGFPAFDEISTTNHEAQMPSGGKPEDFRIDLVLLSNLLVDGENIIAIEVHNSSVNSSDMSSSAFFSVEVDSDENKYLPVPSWFNPPFQFTSSNLPIFIINTDGKAIVDEPKTNVHLSVINNGAGKRNSVIDSVYHYNGTIGIELRGNSTMSFPKKPYTFETRLENGENNNVSLLGFPEENDWILRASYYDHTFIRNPLAHQMSRLMGNWSSGNKHCEVVLNGEYQGIYILLEKIKRTKNRLDLSKLKPDEISGEDLTGGYIFEIAGQYDHFGKARRLRYPDFDEVAPEQLSYIRKYDDDFRQVMQTLSSDDPASVYNEWIDLQTFVDYMIVQEASRNPDGYGWSCYFHKDKNGKLCAGPVWDFDQSMNNSTYRSGWLWEGWSIDYDLWPDPPFYLKMIHEPYFLYQMKKRWETMRENEFSTASLFHYIDSIAENLSESAERNFSKWPTLGTKIWREVPNYQFLDTYEKQVYSLKTYLEKRWAWMDQQMANVSVYSVIESNKFGNELAIYPNPATNYINVDLNLNTSDVVRLKVFNNVGALVFEENVGLQFAGKSHSRIMLPSSMKEGMYLLQIWIGESTVITEKFIKAQ